MSANNATDGRIKCLHMQYADYIGLDNDANVVGRWTVEMLAELEEAEKAKLQK